MKTCFKCQQLLPITEFYKHPAMGDGHLGKCKECNKKDVRENRAKRRDQYAEYERIRTQDEHRKQMAVQYQRNLRANHPEKYRARQMIGNATKIGKLERKPCEFCGNPKSQAHHHDYSKPLDVVWLCCPCHVQRHKEMKQQGLKP